MEHFRNELTRLLTPLEAPRLKLQTVCGFLLQNMKHCDWAGYYLVDPNTEEHLSLGPFAGDFTVHTEIGFGEGICGQVALTEKAFIVADVSAENNYLSCSPEVKSEIAVPIFLDKKLIGELDLDSHSVNGFGVMDQGLLEWIAELTAEEVEMVRNQEVAN